MQHCTEYRFLGSDNGDDDDDDALARRTQVTYGESLL
jgi:hypothetical protein